MLNIPSTKKTEADKYCKLHSTNAPIAKAALEDPDDEKLDGEDPIKNYTLIETGYRRFLWGKLCWMTTIFLILSYFSQHFNENNKFLLFNMYILFSKPLPAD